MKVSIQIKQSLDGWRLIGTPFVFGLLLLLTPIFLMVLLSFWTQDYLD
jgi:ABC-type spermidine/putrescine transport system permease subunit II